MTTESQNKKILAYLLDGKRLTQLDALNLFGCMRLASRICDLRRNYPKLSIKVEKIYTPTTGKRIARYFVDYPMCVSKPKKIDTTNTEEKQKDI